MKSAPIVALYPVVNRPEIYCKGPADDKHYQDAGKQSNQTELSESISSKACMTDLVAETSLADARRTDHHNFECTHAQDAQITIS